MSDVYGPQEPAVITETVFVAGVETDAATGTFTVWAPDGTSTDYDLTDPLVTHPSTGVYVLTLPPQTIPGLYLYQLVTASPNAGSAIGTFNVLATGGARPTGGPCSPWVDPSDVSACCTAAEDPVVATRVAWEASMLMYELSGRLYAGTCTRKVRPCLGACTCWDALALDVFWTGSYWRGDGRSLGCAPVSEVTLAGYPVWKILEVKVDGDVVDPDGYEIVRYRHLRRLRDPAAPNVRRVWPGCQRLDLPDTEPGTFSVEYLHGAEPPLLGQDAARVLACELAKACSGDGKCALPSRVTKVVRQGVTIERTVAAAQMLRKGSSGLPVLDAFISGVNPNGITRRPAVWGPSLPPYPARSGQ